MGPDDVRQPSGLAASVGRPVSAPIDLAQCENEPIHIPGSIQPHGILLGVRESDRQVVVASENASALLGVTGIVGQPLDALLDTGDRISIGRDETDIRDGNPIALRLRDGRAVVGIAHRADGLLILEVELAPPDPDRLTSAFPRLVRVLDRLRHADTVEAISNTAATEVRALTGFDRVMVYRFDARANGQVIAEQRADDTLEPYLGLHYPASDIPPQARRLYVTNPLRLIVDAEYEPVPLVPETNPLTGQPLDLSLSVLRSVSPVHCEYLQNMGVRSSMSISLLDGNELWGLIACHHRTPLTVPYDIRLVGEFLARVLSARISELERIDALTRKTRAYAIQSKLIDQMIDAPRFQDGLVGQGYQLTDLIDCDGAAILYRDEVTRIKNAPTADTIRRFADLLERHAPGEIVATDCLGEIVPDAAAHVEHAAGAIAVPVSSDSRDRIFWFRGEQIRSVTWAGDPGKAAVPSPEGDRLTPRHSFDAWTEDVRGRSIPWDDWEIEVASDFRTALAASIIHQAAELERLNAQLLDESRHKDRFLAAVSHDLRNPLNAILGWVRIARSGVGPEEQEKALETIERNATAQNQLIGDLLDLAQIRRGRLQIDRRPLNLVEIVRQALDTVEPSLRERALTMDADLGEPRADVIGDPGRLRQVVWNLLNNAIKFSPDGASIGVRLERRDSAVAIEVEDAGAGIAPDLLPRIFDPFRQADGPRRRAGLGLGLSIVKNIVELHGGAVTASSEGEGQGSVFTVTLPVAAIRAAVDAAPAPRAMTGVNLDGVRVLVVDDLVDAASMVTTLLERHRASADSATTTRDALERLRRSERFDLLITDIELADSSGLELLQAMRSDPSLSTIPAIAITAHTSARLRAQSIAAGFSYHLAKPVDPEELLAVVARVLSRLD